MTAVYIELTVVYIVDEVENIEKNTPLMRQMIAGVYGLRYNAFYAPSLSLKSINLPSALQFLPAQLVRPSPPVLHLSTP